jgi:hypothetical protein
MFAAVNDYSVEMIKVLCGHVSLGRLRFVLTCDAAGLARFSCHPVPVDVSVIQN